MHLKHPDLLVVLIITVLTLILGLSGIRSGNIEYETMPLWMAPLGVLMVLFVPGYAIATAMLPNIGSEKTLLLSLGLSISVNVVGGLLLNLTPWGLNPATWCLCLGTITLIGLGFGWRQRRIRTRNFEMGIPSLRRENLVIFGLAGVLLLGAVMIAYNSSKHTETTFTQLWAVPSATDGIYEIQVGIRNEEKQPEIYDLYVDIDGRRLQEWPTIPLEAGKEWTAVVQLSEKPSRPIRISLYRINDMANVHRWLRISPEAFK